MATVKRRDVDGEVELLPTGSVSDALPSPLVAGSRLMRTNQKRERDAVGCRRPLVSLKLVLVSLSVTVDKRTHTVPRS
ncbi:Hypothetical protein SMAX5B_017766 [Scophthalmus maximus]|uniref:Uncharacterized protein n=1 Tax=Scophthalmus maximus TaxID=52904 RepID=A0A2U9CEK6_SCOMX|nr:Hypothetical protein SMAX5B_017766 [Scophthalmus maximus]